MKQRSRRGRMHFHLRERRRFSMPLRLFPMARRAVLDEQLAARERGIVPSFIRVGFRRSRGWHTIQKIASESNGKEQNREERSHFPPRNHRPICSISYDAPMRNRKGALDPVSPNPGESFSVTPLGSDHASSGAM